MDFSAERNQENAFTDTVFRNRLRSALKSIAVTSDFTLFLLKLFYF